MDIEVSFAIQLERFLNNTCPDCGGPPLPEDTAEWPYCQRCFELDGEPVNAT